MLWFYVSAYHRTPEENRVFDYARKALTQIPGHTQVMIDRIEEHFQQFKTIKLSTDGKNSIEGLIVPAPTEEQLKINEDLMTRAFITAEREFTNLRELGSAECVQTLMTYMDDERRIGLITGGSEGRTWRASANYWLAVNALGAILKEENPAIPEFINRGGKDYDVTAILNRYKDWWRSDASKKWRTPIVKTSRSHLLPGASKEPAAPSPPATAITPGREALWPILVILCLVTLAAILGFARLRRMQR